MIPVNKNEDYKIIINGMNHEGQGVGRVENFTVFVDGAIEGEEVLVKIIKVNKNYAIGKLLEILKPSDRRVEPFCPSYKRCGGCGIQHISYEGGLKFKTDLVKDALKRIGKLEGVLIHDTIGMENPYYYRNKSQYPVGSVNGQLKAGFYAKRSHDIIESSECNIQMDVSNKVKEIVKDFLIENKIAPYDEKSGKGLIRHIMTRVGFVTGEVMVVLVLNGKSIPAKDGLIEKLTNEIPNIKGIVLNENTSKSNVILGDRNKVIYGESTVTDYIGDFKFNISPNSFFQVNPIQTEVLYQKALEYAQLTGKEVVFDLYCGIGTISLFLSKKAGKVYGVEVVEAAVEDARRNAEINGVQNVEFITGEAEKVIPHFYERGIRADVVVVDPPRKGCDEMLLDTLVKMEPKRIVYVSCNPSTLARDLNYLEEKGFVVKEVQPVDMFPHTTHVEVVVKLRMTKCL